MNDYLKKAQNYFILGKLAEKANMYSESASNYFKALSAANDFMLNKINLKAKDHSERFFLLKQNFPELYEITDKMFLVYRRTYTSEISKEELKIIRKNIELVFKDANIQIPDDKEIKKTAEKAFK